jgi:hypothetical protein
MRCSKGEGVTSLRPPWGRLVDEERDECERDEDVGEGAGLPMRPDGDDARRGPPEVDRVDEDRVEAERDELDRGELRRDCEGPEEP